MNMPTLILPNKELYLTKLFLAQKNHTTSCEICRAPSPLATFSSLLSQIFSSSQTLGNGKELRTKKELMKTLWTGASSTTIRNPTRINGSDNKVPSKAISRTSNLTSNRAKIVHRKITNRAFSIVVRL